MIALLLSVAHASCDPVALTALAEGLPSTAGPSDVAAGLAAACPRPTPWVRALGSVAAGSYDPFLDQQAALSQVGAWTEACRGGLHALPSGYELATPGDRMLLHDRCALGDLGLFDPDEWMSGSGPPITAILASFVLKRDGVPRVARQRLVRALAGLSVDPRVELPPGVDPLVAADPLAAFRDEAAPSVVHLAEVKWPPHVDPEVVCTVRVTIVSDGSSGNLEWVACPEDLRDYVISALEASWFQAGRKRGQPVRGTVQLSFAARPGP